jgi:phytoene/squalene synthetase
MILPHRLSAQLAGQTPGRDLAPAITWAASKQTYFTIRSLADRNRVQDAYRAYAYFRWVDDWLDAGSGSGAERLAFVRRQSSLLESCFRGEMPRGVGVEEQMLIDLVRGSQGTTSGLQTYLRNMMQVMAFDASRRGRLISAEELANYTRWLAVAVTEAMHHFIGHDSPSPPDETRYLAVSAAHITHMLRDTYCDVQAGYFNIPHEFLDAQGIDPSDIGSEGYRAWVKRRVRLARGYFDAGRTYLARVASLRSRLAGYAYAFRFEQVLDLIERESYQLRPAYPERKTLQSGFRMVGTALAALAGWHHERELAAPLHDQARGQQ